MSKDAEKKAGTSAEQENQVQVQLDDSKANVSYASTVQVRGSAEDVTIDFAGPLRSQGPKLARLTIEQRIILNPYAAKRLALALGQAISQFEQTYGPLELDPRKRAINPDKATATDPAASAPAGKKLS